MAAGHYDETTREYVADIFDWLITTFPTPYPVTLRWVPRISHGHDGRKLPKRIRERGIWGDCWRYGRRMEIRLSARRCRAGAIAAETLLHEFAHAVVVRHERVEKHRGDGHDDEWALVYGRLYRAFMEREGARP